MLKNSKWMRVFIAVFSLVSCLFSSRVCAADEEESKVYEYGDYEITYYVDGVWDTGYNVRMQITNKSNIPTKDWEVVFFSCDEIKNTWNAKVKYSDDGTYIIENAGWNKNISSGNSIEWGYTANYDTIPNYPSMIEVREEITENISDEYMDKVLEMLAENEIGNHESVIVDNAYVITCLEEIKEEPQMERGVYTLTRSKKRTFLVTVLGKDKKVFAITQEVMAAFNTYTNEACIKSHSATFTPYSDSYKLVSKKQVSNIDVWGDPVSGIINIKIKKGSTEMLVCASATVFGNEKFTFHIEQVY